MFLIASHLLLSANPSELRNLDNYQINGVQQSHAPTRPAPPPGPACGPGLAQKIGHLTIATVHSEKHPLTQNALRAGIYRVADALPRKVSGSERQQLARDRRWGCRFHQTLDCHSRQTQNSDIHPRQCPSCSRHKQHLCLPESQGSSRNVAARLIETTSSTLHLPAPTGSYGVGRVSYAFTDPSRLELDGRKLRKRK